MKNKIHALILSAGLSSRMGSPKALLDWHGKKLIDYQIETFHDLGIDKVSVVLGHDKEKILPYISKKSVRIINNLNYKEGKSTSILEGIHSIIKEAENVILISVDQPRPAWFLKKIVTNHFEKKAIITAPIFEQKRGHPIILNEKIYNQILQINEYKNGLKDIFRKNNDLVNTVIMKNNWTHLDLNTKEIYQKALLYSLENHE